MRRGYPEVIDVEQILPYESPSISVSDLLHLLIPSTRLVPPFHYDCGFLVNPLRSEQGQYVVDLLLRILPPSIRLQLEDGRLLFVFDPPPDPCPRFRLRTSRASDYATVSGFIVVILVIIIRWSTT